MWVGVRLARGYSHDDTFAIELAGTVMSLEKTRLRRFPELSRAEFVVHFPSEIPFRAKRLKRNGIEAHYLNTRGRGLGRDPGRSRHPPQTRGQIGVLLRAAACRSQRRGDGYEF